MRVTQFGKYKVLDKLGQGAMGEVFRAHDPVLGRDVAVKILTGKSDDDEPARQRFLREARAAAQLNHPNIVTVFDFGEEKDIAFMAMELLEGTDLRTLIEKRRISTLQDKLALMEQILDGVAFAHSKGLVHRDLKPGNIHVLPTGQVKIMDFGLARREQDAVASGTVMGTPYYMAPEQAQGKAFTTRSDVFSLGAVFYELLAGRRPFTGPSIPAVLFAVAHKEAQPLTEAVPDLPPALSVFVAQALAKNPELRYADAAEMLETLRLAWSDGQVPSAAAQTSFAVDDEPPARDLPPPPSSRPDLPAETREAIDELTQYLADRVAPLMAADSVSVFGRLPALDSAAELWNWAERQRARQELHPVVDLLFHALRKLAVIGELQLLPRDPLIDYLKTVGVELAGALQPVDRGPFLRALRHLGEAEMVATGSGSGRFPTSEATAAPVRNTSGMRRLSLLEQRLRRVVKASTPKVIETRRRMVSQAITVAATEARSERELEDHLRRLRRVGVASGADQVFRNLGSELPDLALPKAMLDTADLGPSNEVQAMQRLVALPEDPLEVARRYRHLVDAAIEQFNAGNLGGAVQMFELASRLATEKSVQNTYTEPVRARGHEALDPVRMRQYLEHERQDELQPVLAFFTPGLSPATLLDALDTEERRDRRRLLLDLLVLHGTPARNLTRERLYNSVHEPASDFSRRNWIYLLRLMPRPSGDDVEREIAQVGRFAAPGAPPVVTKETLLYLGQNHHPQSAQMLIELLALWEGDLEFGRIPESGLEDALSTVDRICSALARQNDPRAWRAVVGHGLSRKPAFGKTLDRLGDLGLQDLSGAPDAVEELAAAVKDALPRGVLGRLVARREHELPALTGALSGTRSPLARETLAEVRRRAPGQVAARPSRAPEGATPPPKPALPNAGELQPFALAGLLQRIAEARATGSLSLLPTEGLPARVAFAAGRPVSAEWAQRSGRDAFTQLFLRPITGRFVFDANARPAASLPLGEVPQLVRDAIRRGRELRRALALVPTDVPLEVTGEAPGTIDDEADYDVVVALWERVCAGLSVERMESELPIDSSRILGPLAQWMEEGALRAAEPAEDPGGGTSDATGPQAERGAASVGVAPGQTAASGAASSAPAEPTRADGTPPR